MKIIQISIKLAKYCQLSKNCVIKQTEKILTLVSKLKQNTIAKEKRKARKF